METTIESAWERHIVVDAFVNHPVDAVFPYLAEPTKWHDFAPAVEYREQIDAGRPQVGTRWRGTDRLGPFRIHFVDELDVLDENRRVVWVSTAPWNSRVEYACEGSGAGTRIRADYLGRLTGSTRWQVGWLPIWGWHLLLVQFFLRRVRLLTLRAGAAVRYDRV